MSRGVLKAIIGAMLLPIGLIGSCDLCAANVSKLASETTPAKESWQKEFDQVCSITQDAMTLSSEELMLLIQRCNALKPKLESVDDTEKKVYMERLRKCRGVYAYVLDSKKNEKR